MKAITARSALALSVAALLAVSLAACVADDAGTGNAGGNTDKGDLQCGLANGEDGDRRPDQGRRDRHGKRRRRLLVGTEVGGSLLRLCQRQRRHQRSSDRLQLPGRRARPDEDRAACGRVAADKDIVGLVGDATFIGCDVANAEYVKGGLYSITGVGVPQACFNSSNLAPVNAGPRQSAIQLMQWLQQEGKADAVFTVGLNTQGNGDWVAAGIDEYADANGINIVGTELSDPTESNWLPLIQKIKDSGATSVIIVDPGPITAAILAAVEQQDARGDITWTCTASCYDAQFGSQIGAYWEGFVANSELQLVDASGTDNELWKSVMDAYADADAPRDTFSQAGFLAAKIFTDALLKFDPANISRETVSQAMLGITNYSSDLLCRPWYYGESGRAQRQPLDAYRGDHERRVHEADRLHRLGRPRPLVDSREREGEGLAG